MDPYSLTPQSVTRGHSYYSRILLPSDPVTTPISGFQRRQSMRTGMSLSPVPSRRLSLRGASNMPGSVSNNLTSRSCRASNLPTLFNFRPQSIYNSTALRRKTDHVQNAKILSGSSLVMEPCSVETVNSSIHVERGLRILESRKRPPVEIETIGEQFQCSEFPVYPKQSPKDTKRRRLGEKAHPFSNIAEFGCIDEDKMDFQCTSISQLRSRPEQPRDDLSARFHERTISSSLDFPIICTASSSNVPKNGNLIPVSTESQSTPTVDSQTSSSWRRRVPYMSPMELETHVFSRHNTSNCSASGFDREALREDNEPEWPTEIWPCKRNQVSRETQVVQLEDKCTIISNVQYNNALQDKDVDSFMCAQNMINGDGKLHKVGSVARFIARLETQKHTIDAAASDVCGKRKHQPPRICSDFSDRVNRIRAMLSTGTPSDSSGKPLVTASTAARLTPATSIPLIAAPICTSGSTFSTQPSSVTQLPFAFTEPQTSASVVSVVNTCNSTITSSAVKLSFTSLSTVPPFIPLSSFSTSQTNVTTVTTTSAVVTTATASNVKSSTIIDATKQSSFISFAPLTTTTSTATTSSLPTLFTSSQTTVTPVLGLNGTTLSGSVLKLGTPITAASTTSSSQALFEIKPVPVVSVLGVTSSNMSTSGIPAANLFSATSANTTSAILAASLFSAPPLTSIVSTSVTSSSKSEPSSVIPSFSTTFNTKSTFITTSTATSTPLFSVPKVSSNMQPQSVFGGFVSSATTSVPSVTVAGSVTSASLFTVPNALGTMQPQSAFSGFGPISSTGLTFGTTSAISVASSLTPKSTFNFGASTTVSATTPGFNFAGLVSKSESPASTIVSSAFTFGVKQTSMLSAASAPSFPSLVKSLTTTATSGFGLFGNPTASTANTGIATKSQWVATNTPSFNLAPSFSFTSSTNSISTAGTNLITSTPLFQSNLPNKATQSAMLTVAVTTSSSFSFGFPNVGALTANTTTVQASTTPNFQFSSSNLLPNSNLSGGFNFGQPPSSTNVPLGQLAPASAFGSTTSSSSPFTFGQQTLQHQQPQPQQSPNPFMFSSAPTNPAVAAPRRRPAMSRRSRRP